MLIDILLGRKIFWKILVSKQIAVGPNLSASHKSKFGWLVSGIITISRNAGKHCLIVSQQADEHLLHLLERLWTS